MIEFVVQQSPDTVCAIERPPRRIEVASRQMRACARISSSARLAHGLAGAAGIIREEQLVSLARRAERQSREADLGDARNAVDALERALRLLED